MVVGNSGASGELTIGSNGWLTVTSTDKFRIGYGGGDGKVSVAGGLTVGWDMTLGEWGAAGGTLEVVGSAANITVGGNFIAGNDDNAPGTTTFNTLRFVPDSGGISTINVTGQTYFWPGSNQLHIVDGPIPMGSYTLISSGSLSEDPPLGTHIEDMAFAPGVNTNRFSFEVIGDDLILHVLLPPDCDTFLGGDLSNDCTVNFVDIAMLADEWLETAP